MLLYYFFKKKKENKPEKLSFAPSNMQALGHDCCSKNIESLNILRHSYPDLVAQKIR